MLNLLQKLHCLYLSPDVRIWHFPRADGPRFFYWLASEPDNAEGHKFASLEEMIEAAYAHIDPLARPLPDAVPVPPEAREC